MATKDDARFEIPEGHDPAEFLNDAQLAVYHARQLEDAFAQDPDDPRIPELRLAARAARRAAGETAEAVAIATAAAEADLAEAESKKPKK